MKTPAFAIEPLESRIAPATFTVTSTADPTEAGKVTLRDALALADANPATHDTIIFNLPTGEATNGIFTIALDGNQLTSLGNVTITGPGPGKLILDAANNSRILNINSGGFSAMDRPVSISGLSMIHGNALSGGAINLEEVSLSLKNVIISESTATGGGGAVNVAGSTTLTKVSISNSLITVNSAGFAAGMDLNDLKSLTLTNTTISQNTCLNADSIGGGLDAEIDNPGAMSISGCRITGNSAAIGGGLWLEGSTAAKISVSNSQIVGNFSTGTAQGDGGGGIFLGTGTAIISGTTIIGNSAKEGGGGIQSSGSNSVTISNCTISENKTGDVGGGFNLSNSSSVKIAGTAITFNTDTSTTHGAGGGYLGVPAAGKGATISSCVISGNTADHGAGLFVTSYATSPSAKITVSSTKITGNSAIGTTAGGGGLYAEYGITVVSGSTISDNRAVYYGGGVEAKGFASLGISNTTFNGNLTTAKTSGLKSGGGGVFIQGAATGAAQPVNVTSSKFIGNKSAEYGGGILVTGGLSPTISGCTFTNNAAFNSGGGVAAIGDGTSHVDLTVSGGAFSENTGILGYGGAIFAEGTGSASITSSKVTGNVAAYGGGIAVDTKSTNVPVTLTKLSMAGNFGSYGGGIWVNDTPDFKISGSSITNNSGAQGGGVYLFNSTGSIEGVTISGNAASADGGGIYQTGTGTITLQIAKVIGNLAPSGADTFGTFTPFP